jgi:SAM-dependent methyltransferase
MNDNPGAAFSNASAYEIYVGRWSRLVAKQFVTWLDIPFASTWLDVGAGTGILTQVILERNAPQKVIGLDLSAQYLEYARQVITDKRVEWIVGNASEIVLDAPAFDVAVAGLVLNFVSSPEDLVRAMKNAVRKEGVIAAYVWDYGDRMEMMRHFWDAAIAIDPSAKAFDAGTQFAICDPSNLQSLFATTGIKEIEVFPIDIQTHFSNFDDFWLPFLGTQGSVSAYLRSLDQDRRNAIQKQLLHQLPMNHDNSIHLSARAWAIKGRR